MPPTPGHGVANPPAALSPVPARRLRWRQLDRWDPPSDHRCHVRTLLILLLWTTALVAAPQDAGLKSLVGTTLTARVTTVVDGDTVHVVADGGRELVVRLEGIDTPERGEPFSTEARNAARVLLFGKGVRLKATDVDRYGRLVARVSVAGTDSSLALVSMGVACHLTRFSNDPELARAQDQARARGAGFWAAGATRPACASGDRRTPPGAPVAGPFHGNAQSHVFHAPGCPNYRCRNCTAVFQTREDAVAAGFKPAGDCLR